MIRIRPRPRKAPAENTVALVNIVFLMLTFFLIAGAITPPLDPQISLIETSESPPLAPPDALAVRADGQLTHRGQTTTLDAFLSAMEVEGSEHGQTKLVVDKDLTAIELVDLLTQLKSAGAGNIAVVTERAAGQ